MVTKIRRPARHVAEDHLSVTALADDWHVDLRAARKSPGTLHVYGNAVKSYVKHGGDDLSGLTRHSVRRWLVAMEGQSACTQRSDFIGMACFTRWLAAEKLIEASPMAGLQRPQAPAVPVQPYADSEVQALLDTCVRGKQAHRDRAIIMLLAATGMRISELTSMTLGSLDMTEKVIAVIGKGKKPRLIPFSDDAGRALRRYLRIRGQMHPGNELVWQSQRGPLTSGGVDTMLRNRARKAGVRNVHAHRFRHSMACKWIADGGSELALMSIAGWSSMTMMARYTAARQAENAISEYRRLR